MHFLTNSSHNSISWSWQKEQPTWRNLSCRKFSHLWQSKCGSRPEACRTRNTAIYSALIWSSRTPPPPSPPPPSSPWDRLHAKIGLERPSVWTGPVWDLHSQHRYCTNHLESKMTIKMLRDNGELIRPSVKILYLILDVIFCPVKQTNHKINDSLLTLLWVEISINSYNTGWIS